MTNWCICVTIYMKEDKVVESLGKQIKKARQDSGYTQSQLASKIGCSVNTVSRWEQDKYSPSAKDLTKLAHLLDVEFVMDEVAKHEEESSLEMKLEDIRLELAGSTKKAERWIMVLVIVMLVLLLSIIVFIISTQKRNPNSPKKSKKISRYGS